MAAAAFHRSGHTEVAEIQDAYQLLTPAGRHGGEHDFCGSAAGRRSELDFGGHSGRPNRDGSTAKLLVFSQVILSLRLSFAVVPLVQFTSDKAKIRQFQGVVRAGLVGGVGDR